MKKIIKNFQIPFLGYLLFLALLGTSCQKSDVAPGSSELKKERELKAARTLASRLPEFSIYDDKTKRTLHLKSGGFTFTDNSEEGFNFSDPRGLTYTNTNTGGKFVVAAQGFGSNTGGGSGGLIQIGGSNLNVKYTFCFSADETFFGGNLFSEGGDGLFDGVSGVIGVDGDFTQIQNGGGNGDDDLEELFSGLGMYIVYDSKAQGSYDILDWIDLVQGDEETSPDDLQDKGFAFFIDFKNKKIYFSYNGTLNVSGGSMTFTGKYFEFDPENDDEYRIVDGLGTMGCE